MTDKKHRPIFWIVILIVLLLGAGQILSSPLNQNSSTLVINEFIAANGTGLTDEDGDYSDWIEIHNQTGTAINLAGWSLTDDPNQPQKWTFPDLSLGSGQYLLVFASGKDRRPAEANALLHTNFKLNKKGEFLALYNILEDHWQAVTRPVYPRQFQDLSYGRYGEPATYGYMGQPTPGRPNDESLVWTGLVDKVAFSHSRGFYNTPIRVSLNTSTPDTTIYYTTDGSRPGEATGTLYTGPVEIKQTTPLRAVATRPDWLPSEVNTHTYLFLDDILAQSNRPPPDFPPFDYEMDPEIVNHPDYKESIKEDLKAIPTLSLVTDAQSFLDLYTNPRERGEAWERPVSVEMFYPDRAEGFQINAGLRIQGGFGRWEVMPKHSFRLFFKGKYGPTKLNYSLFPDSPVKSFDTVVLRSGVNRSYAGKMSGAWEDHRLATYTRDEWLRASQRAMTGVGSHGIFVHLYVNGLYWGLYNLVERPDASFMAAYLGGEKEDWYAMNHSGFVSGPDDKIVTLLQQFANQESFEDPNKYEAIKEVIDLTSFIDTVILNFYAGNTDWSDSNWYAGFQAPSGKVQFFVWDGELTWSDGAELAFVSEASTEGEINLFTPAFKALIKNPDFKMEFADKLYHHLFNGGALTDANSQARWLRLNQEVNRAIVGESARWGDARYEVPITRQDWLNARDNVLAQMEGNAEKLIELSRARGYYPPIDPPRFNQHGGQVPTGFRLTMTAPEGTVYYTTDGTDPRLPTSQAVSPQAVAYRSPMPITTTTHLKARVLAEEDSSTGAAPVWSALAEATFTVVAQDPQIRITELMYNPPDRNIYEFIEIKNIGNAELNLAGMFFEGIEFTFPPGTPPLLPGQFFVLVNEPSAFAARYPEVVIGGQYTGRLANAGERITLRDSAGNPIISFAYDDDNGWPLSADGRGDSLVLTNLTGDPNDPKNWQASFNPHGSPGADDPIFAQSN